MKTNNTTPAVSTANTSAADSYFEMPEVRIVHLEPARLLCQSGDGQPQQTQMYFRDTWQDPSAESF